MKHFAAAQPVNEVDWELGVTDQTLYNWKAKYGGMEVNGAKRLPAPNDENRRTKEIVADLRIDKEAMNMVGLCERVPGRGAGDGGISPERAPWLQGSELWVFCPVNLHAPGDQTSIVSSI